jgi:thiol-disulfide isomerase/thioredoxin
MNRWLAFGMSALVVVGMSSCEDSETRRARYSEKKPAPQPLERTFTPPPAPEPEQQKKSVGPVMVEYKGEDIVQLTGLSGRNVLLVFYAPWCPNCAKYRQSLTEYAHEQQGATLVVTIDADKYPELAREYSVDAVPKTVLYVEGMRLRDMVGNVSAGRLAGLIDETLRTEN